jgi:hypothetical protein
LKVLFYHIRWEGLIMTEDVTVIIRAHESAPFLIDALDSIGAAVDLVDRLTCPQFGYLTYSEDQAFHERL